MFSFNQGLSWPLTPPHHGCINTILQGIQWKTISSYFLLFTLCALRKILLKFHIYVLIWDVASHLLWMRLVVFVRDLISDFSLPGKIVWRKWNRRDLILPPLTCHANHEKSYFTLVWLKNISILGKFDNMFFWTFW